MANKEDLARPTDSEQVEQQNEQNPDADKKSSSNSVTIEFLDSEPATQHSHQHTHTIIPFWMGVFYCDFG